MNYTLRFVPLSPSHRIAGVGMAGNIMIITNELLTINDDDNVWVNMCDYETICGINKDESLWGKFFSQVDKPNTSTNIDLISRPAHIDYKAKYGLNTELMIKCKERFFKHFQLNEEIKDSVNTFYENNIKGIETLGCQIRLGDMVNNHNTSTVTDYLARIKTILNDKPNIKQLFIATDDDKAIRTLEANLNIPIKYQKNIYRTSSNDPYTRLYNNRPDHNFNLCKEVIMDIFLLTKCDYFLRAHTSSVSIITTMFSENLKEIYFI
jgi:hypothetical protein